MLVVFVFAANAPGVDVSGLVAGILAVLVSAVFATVLGIYCYKAKNKSGRRSAPEVHPDVNIHTGALLSS